MNGKKIIDIISEELNYQHPCREYKCGDITKYLDRDKFQVNLTFYSEDYDRIKQEAKENGYYLAGYVNSKLNKRYGIQELVANHHSPIASEYRKKYKEDHARESLNPDNLSNKILLNFIDVNDKFELDGDAFERGMILRNYIKYKLNILDPNHVRSKKRRTSFCTPLNNDNPKDHYLQLIMTEDEKDRLKDKLISNNMSFTEYFNKVFGKEMIKESFINPGSKNG